MFFVTFYEIIGMNTRRHTHVVLSYDVRAAPRRGLTKAHANKVRVQADNLAGSFACPVPSVFLTTFQGSV